MIRYEWVWVDEYNAYIVEEWLAEFIYQHVKKDEIEFVTKALILLKPKDRYEAEEFLEYLRKADVQKIIDIIFERNR